MCIVLFVRIMLLRFDAAFQGEELVVEIRLGQWLLSKGVASNRCECE